MGLSNAERQKRHRERLKAKLAGAANSEVLPLREAVNKAAALHRAKVESGENPKAPSANDIILQLVDLAAELDAGDVLVVALLEQFGLPTNPWPGLTHSDLKRMAQ